MDLPLGVGQRKPSIAQPTLRRGVDGRDYHDRYLRVMGKGRKEREIGMHPEVGKLLWKYIHKYRTRLQPADERVFIGRKGKPLEMSGVEEIFKQLQRRCGLEGVRVSPHTF